MINTYAERQRVAKKRNGTREEQSVEDTKMSTYRKPWNNEDLRTWMIQHDFPGFEDCGHFTTVIYNGAFTTLSFIHRPGAEGKAEKYAVVSSVRECHGNAFAHYAKMVKELTKEEGNMLWKAIKSTEWTSKNHTFCYDLGKALDRLPSDSTLKAKFVGA